MMMLELTKHMIINQRFFVIAKLEIDLLCKLVHTMSFEQLERTVQIIVKILYTYDLGPK